MSNSYIEVTSGKNSWWRYLLALFISFASYAFIPAIIMLLGVYLDTNPKTYMDLETGTIIGVSPLQEHFLFHISLIVVFLIIWLSVRFILKRPLKTLITKSEKIDWQKIIWSFKVFSFLLLASILCQFFLNPEGFSLNKFQIIDYVFIFLTTLFLTPFQTTIEELLFRGLLIQWIAKVIKRPLVLALIVGLLFGLLHFGNPEMNESFLMVGLDYMFAGFMITYIATKTKSLELSIGAHAANNMWLYWLITMDNSVGEGLPSLFYVRDINPVIATVLDMLVYIAFYYLIYKKYIIIQQERNNKIIQIH